MRSLIAMGTLKSQVLKNASMKNVSTKQDISRGWKMQVLKTQVRVRIGEKRKYGKTQETSLRRTKPAVATKLEVPIN